MPITHQSKMPVTMLVTICLAASSLVIDGRFYNTNRRICSRNISSLLHSHSLSGQAPHVHFSPSATYFCSWFGPTSAAEKLILSARETELVSCCARDDSRHAVRLGHIAL